MMRERRQYGSVMKTMRKFLRGLSRSLGIVTVLIGLLTIFGAGNANARQGDPSQGPIVALGFDGGTRTLLKAYPQALYRSGDEGRNWTRISLPPAVADGSIAAVAASAQRKSALYIGGPGLGVLRSEDGGRSWVARNEGLPDKKVTALTVHADQPNTVYTNVSAQGIFRSEDGGGSWRLMDKGPRETIAQFIHSNMSGSMQTGWFFAATAKGVSRSMDCFCGWRDAGGLGRRVHTVAYDPHQAQHVYAATDNGLFLSTNGGEQWTPVNSPRPDITALIVTPSGVLYAATGNGDLFRSADQANTWERIGA